VTSEKSSSCYFGRRWAPISFIFSGVSSDFQGFCKGFHRFCPEFHGFCPDFKGFCPDFTKSKLLVVRLHPLHPHLLHWWITWRDWSIYHQSTTFVLWCWQKIVNTTLESTMQWK